MTDGAACPAPGDTVAETWPAFVERFQQQTLQHTIGRVVSVLAGGVLVAAVYRLGRVRFSRAVSLLAAAMTAVDPVLVMTEHQTRPYVPVAAVMVLAAPRMLRLVERFGTRGAAAPAESGGRAVIRALLAGAAAGVAAAVLQVGALIAIAGVALLVLLVRPLRRALLLSGGVVAGTAAVTWTVDALLRATGRI